MRWPLVASAIAAVFAACSSNETGTTVTSTVSSSSAASSSAGGSGTGGSGGSGGAPSCDPSSLAGILVTEKDAFGGVPYALGYPPYAIDGCVLVYVAPDGSLKRRDLTSGMETAIAPKSDAPRRPTIAGDLIAFEATANGVSEVHVFTAGNTTTVTGTFDHAGEPRATEDAVVFTGWLGPKDTDDTDVFVVAKGSAMAMAIQPGKGQQRWADISATDIAFTDFSEDMDGTFNDDGNDVADVVIVDRKTGMRHDRKKPGKQAFPLLGAPGKLGYLDWGFVHPEPKFSEYDLLVGDVMGDVALDQKVTHVRTTAPYVRPTARGTLVEWVQWDLGQQPVLYGQPADLSSAPSVELMPNENELYGPSTSASMTIVAARSAAGPMKLLGALRKE